MLATEKKKYIKCMKTCVRSFRKRKKRNRNGRIEKKGQTGPTLTLGKSYTKVCDRDIG